MEIKQPTQQQIEDAKEYLRQRVDAELSMQNDVDMLLNEYAALFVAMLIDGATDDEIETLVQELIERLLSDCHILGVDERTEREDDIIAYMDMEREGKTLEDRISERCNTFVDEIAMAVAAGEILDLEEEEILSSVRSSFDHPFDNKYIVEARKKQQQGEVDPDDYDFDEPSYGRGVEKSSMGALKMIGAYSIADAWMWDLFRTNSEAKGYFVLRGSSYPCEECDEVVNMGFHPMSDISHFVPIHPHCKCFVVFV